MLAGLASVDGGQRVPMVRRRDDDGIDVLILQKTAIIFVCRAVAAIGFLDRIAGLVQMRGINVANRDHIRQIGAHVAAPLVGDADAADFDAVVGTVGLGRRRLREQAAGDTAAQS